MTLLTLLNATTGGGGVTASIVGVTRTPSDGTDATGASLALTIPAGTAIDDYAVLILELWDSTTTNPVLTYPGGFSQIVNYVSTTDGFEKLKVAIKPLTAADSGTYSVSGFASHFRQGHVAILRGIDLTTALDVAVNLAQNSTGTALPANSITTVTDGCLLMHVIANENTCTGLPATGYTEQADSNYTKTNTKLQTTAGTDSISGGSFSASTLKLGALIAFRPAAGGGTTGTVAVTQANQTSAASGQLGYSGSSAATEAADTSSATGTVVNPVTGTSAASQANQTASASGQLGYSGTSARTQANQTSTASGTFTGSGFSWQCAAVTQAANTASASGQLGYSGTASTDPGQPDFHGIRSARLLRKRCCDTGSADLERERATRVHGYIGHKSGSPDGLGFGHLHLGRLVLRDRAVTQANQTSTARRASSATAASAAHRKRTRHGNRFGAVVNPVTGTASPSQANQSAAASGILRYTGTLAVSQASNTASIQGVSFIPITGTLATTQANQTASASGSALGATVIRPNTGNTSRPTSGTTPRPFVGVVERP
jgi:hypothetical protein